MPRLAWLTDVHLNFVTRRAVEELLALVASHDPDAVVLTGDIAEAQSFRGMLLRMAEAWQRPIYFVLGNHDFYFGTIEGAREMARLACRQSPWLHWLSEMDAVALSPRTALVGHDGWADGRVGDHARSRVRLSDFQLIGELIGLSGLRQFRKLNELGDEARAHFDRVLPPAVERYEQVIVATHVPPFREATWHRGKISEPDWLPFFSCQASGEAIRAAFETRPACTGLVLCGHTHGAGEVDILANLHVSTGGAEYYRPSLDRVVEVP